MAIEVDVTNSSLNRFGIYSRLGVVELWRLDGDELRFHVRGADGRYVEVPTSPTFTGLRGTELVPFLQHARNASNQNEVTRDFRGWVQEKFGEMRRTEHNQTAGGEPAAG